MSENLCPECGFDDLFGGFSSGSAGEAHTSECMNCGWRSEP
jgi:hypothetical protein